MGEQHTRHCPSPDTVNTYLSIISDEPSTLSSSSLICIHCYKFFNKFNDTSSEVKTDTEASNIDLNTVLGELGSQIDAFNAKVANIDTSEFYELIFCHSAKKIAKTLANNEVMLLSAEYKAFYESVITPNQYNITVNIAEVPCKRWFISKLNHYFGEDIAFACKHKRFGTMIYHKNCDLLNALSLDLGRQTAKASEPLKLSNTASPSIEQQVKTVALHLNAKLHKQSQEIVKRFMPPENYLQMNLSELIKKIDPVLLDFLQQLTCTTKTRRRKLFNATDDTKSIRQLYALCVLLFNTNNTCSAPLHVLLTDCILCHGGSLELVRIMKQWHQ